jgi:hypothetical protein
MTLRPGPCSVEGVRGVVSMRVFRHDVDLVFVATADSSDEASRPVVHSTTYINRKTKKGLKPSSSLSMATVRIRYSTTSKEAAGRNLYPYSYPRIEIHTCTHTRQVLGGYRVPSGLSFHI